MGRRDLRKVTQRKPKTKGKGDKLIDWTIKDLDRRNKSLQQQLDLYGRQLLHGMDETPHKVTQPKRRGNVKQPSIEERRKKEEEEVQKALGQDAEGNTISEVGRNWENPYMGPEQPEITFEDGAAPSDQDIQGLKNKTDYNNKRQSLMTNWADIKKQIDKLDFQYNEVNNVTTEINLNKDQTFNQAIKENLGVNPGLGDDTDSKTITGETAIKEAGDYSVEQGWYQSGEDEKAAEKQYKIDQDFLNKSNNAAARSGAFTDEELLALRDRHRSGEWRNKSDVDTKAGTNIGQLFKSNRRESN